MYAYFIDSWVAEKRQRKLDKLDLGLTQKGITGKKIKMGRLHDLEGSVKECFAQGIKTFVAVGDDETASRILNSVLRMQQKPSFVFSFISMSGGESLISKVLGYSSIQESIDALKALRTVKIDIGILNSRHYFITSAVFPYKCSFGFESYSVSSLRKNHHISVCNINIYKNQEYKGTPMFRTSDGLFEAIIAYKPKESFFEKLYFRKEKPDYILDSIFQVKAIKIKSNQKTVSVLADAQKQFTAPVMVEVLPRFLEIVVGGDLNG